MTMSTYTYTEAATFTITHARHMAAKVATDLKRLQRFYGTPSDAAIADLEEELVQLVRAGYLGTVTYGFKKGEAWIEPTLRYTARQLAGGASANDDDPGRVRPGANTDGAAFYSYLSYSSSWNLLSQAERERFAKELLERNELDYDDIEAIFKEYGKANPRISSKYVPPKSA